MAIFLIIGVIAVVLGILAAVYKHQRDEVFEGEVIDKDVQESVNTPNYENQNQPGIHVNTRLNIGSGGNNVITHTYFVKIRLPDGKTKSWTVSEGKYQIIKIGDRVAKPAGTTDLQILSSSAPAPTANPG